jgi:hypothetical protein
LQALARAFAIGLLLLGMANYFVGQTPGVGQTPAPLPASSEVYACPMDPDVRGHDPGTCPRCGMKLVAGIPDPVEYSMDMKLTPPGPKPLQPAQFAFIVRDPWKDRPVSNFQLVHERLFHLFVVSQDMKFFVHDHPVYHEDGTFTYDIAFPKSGMYRILGDFYPDGATPQLIAKTVMVPGAAQPAANLTRDYSTKTSENMQVELITDPPQPIAHTKTMMFFKVKPGDGLEKLLGAWGHMLAASDDLIDMIHTHPFLADGGPEIQFNVIFPRAHNYRVWVQFQRQGVVNTVYFDVPVKDLE